MAISARLMATAVPLSVWTKCVPFSPLCLIADSQPAGLVVGAIGGAGHFAVFARFAAAGHPGLEIELAIGRPAQIAGGRVDHAVGNAQAVENVDIPGGRSSRACASLSSGSVKANISTLVNWWTRYRPRVARPWAPASVR